MAKPPFRPGGPSYRRGLLLLQRLTDCFTDKGPCVFPHGSDSCVDALREAHAVRPLSEGFLALRDAVLMLSEVFY